MFAKEARPTLVCTELTLVTEGAVGLKTFVVAVPATVVVAVVVEIDVVLGNTL